MVGKHIIRVPFTQIGEIARRMRGVCQRLSPGLRFEFWGRGGAGARAWTADLHRAQPNE
jgi:hypothetical protein